MTYLYHALMYCIGKKGPWIKRKMRIGYVPQHSRSIIGYRRESEIGTQTPVFCGASSQQPLVKIFFDEGVIRQMGIVAYDLVDRFGLSGGKSLFGIEGSDVFQETLTL